MSNSNTQSPDKKIRTIFMGTPEFACPALRSLASDSYFDIIGVFTQPDKPVGRKHVITPTPVKSLALEKDLPIFQPLRIKQEVETIKNLKPDLIVVVAYGQIISQAILDIPRYGCINVHASLLPKYRGAACLNAPILYGDKETGVTIMVMDAGLDTGPILRQTKVDLAEQENLTLLHDKLSEIGAQVLPQTLKDFIAGEIKPRAQDNSQSSYIKVLDKEDGHIDWKNNAVEIERMVRAYNPWPGTFTVLEKETSSRTVKILAVGYKPLAINDRQPGELFRHEKDLAIQCGQDSLVILKLQIAGGRPMEAKDFLAGYSGLMGKVLD